MSKADSKQSIPHQAIDHGLLKSIIESSHDAIISKSMDGIVTSWNSAAENIFGYSAKEMIGEPMLKVFPQDRHDEESVLLSKIAHGDKVENFHTVRQRKDGTLIHVSASLSPLYNDNGDIIGISKIAHDITEEVEHDQLNKIYHAIIESSDDAIIGKTLDGIVTSWNTSAERIFGYSAEEMIGQPMIKIFPKERIAEEKMILEKIAQGKKVDHFKTERLRKDGQSIFISATISPILDIDGKVIGVSKIARDITQEVEAERKIWFQANHDLLTGIPNRKYFLEQTHQILETSNDDTHFHLMFIDLDNFKSFNDNFGHEFGDEVIKTAANALKSVSREKDIPARFAGDEFVMLIGGQLSNAEITKMVEDINLYLSENSVIFHTPTEITMSIGIASYPSDSSNYDDLVRCADFAMYTSKKNGRNQCTLFSEL